MTDIVAQIRAQDFATIKELEAADEIERLQKEVMAWWKETEIMRKDLYAYSKALQFYTCGCKEDKCTPEKPKFRDIKCGWIAREALEIK